MATNDLTITQISTVLNEIVGQATGQKVIAPIDGSAFATVAQIGLKCAPDVILNSISQVLSRTIFSIRPYTAKFRPLMVSTQRYGNIVRKLNIADKDWKDNEEYNLVDGDETGTWLVCLPKILQTNFYGANTYERCMMIFYNQFWEAFRSAQEFGSFYSLIASNVSDQIAQAHENLARALVGNFIAGKISANNGVIHLLTEYNSRAGTELTPDTVYAPENFKPFMQYVAGRIRAIKASMTERTINWHINVEGKEISRHTPYERQKMFLYAPDMYFMEASVLSELFNDDYVKLGENEVVNFWQSVNAPDEINITPVYMGTDGNLVQPEEAVKQSNIFGVIFDEEALGMTVINNWSSTTPLNSKKGFWNTFYHFTDRYWSDFTENGCVLLLD